MQGRRRPRPRRSSRFCAASWTGCWPAKAPRGALFPWRRELLRVRLDRGGQRELVAAAFVADALAECPDAAFEVQRDQRRCPARSWWTAAAAVRAGPPSRWPACRPCRNRRWRSRRSCWCPVGRIQRGHPNWNRSLARRPAAHREADSRLAREIDRGGHRVDRGLDADARQVLGHGLGDLAVVDVAVVGGRDGQFEAVRVAGLGQQLLGAFGVVLISSALGRAPNMPSGMNW